jgi:hypothetical protein
MFEITVDEEGSRFCGLFMDWDYEGAAKSTSQFQDTYKQR